VLLLRQAAPSKDLEIVSELARLGYAEARNINYEIRSAGSDVTRLPLLAHELVATRPDVIVGSTSEVAIALFDATRDIPIVMTLVSDPIALGLTHRMSRPTQNVTGFPMSTLSLTAKWLEILQ
jgi:putative ABC transport system substrate-binding protein